MEESIKNAEISKKKNLEESFERVSEKMHKGKPGKTTGRSLTEFWNEGILEKSVEDLWKNFGEIYEKKIGETPEVIPRGVHEGILASVSE